MARFGENWREKITGVAAILTLGLGLTALFLGIEWFWMIFVFGFAVVVPLLAILLETGEETESTDEPSGQPDEQDALETLRDRYARGELDDCEFERKVEKLVENESIEQIEARVEKEEVERERERAGR